MGSIFMGSRGVLDATFSGHLVILNHCDTMLAGIDIHLKSFLMKVLVECNSICYDKWLSAG